MSSIPETKDSRPTPRPWEVHDDTNIRSVGGQHIGVASGPHTIGATPEVMERRRQEQAEDRANAEFIVRAVNCHEDLLEALEGIWQWLGVEAGNRTEGDWIEKEPWVRVRAAIEKARGA